MKSRLAEVLISAIEFHRAAYHLQTRILRVIASVLKRLSKYSSAKVDFLSKLLQSDLIQFIQRGLEKWSQRKSLTTTCLSLMYMAIEISPREATDLIMATKLCPMMLGIIEKVKESVYFCSSSSSYEPQLALRRSEFFRIGS